ncbi:MAG: MarR family transcriptional regulator [Pseudomonadota bacterium]
MALNERQALTLWRRTVVASVRSDKPDLTARQQAILLTVSMTRGPHTVRGLAEALDVAKPAITRALDTLTRSNLIRRVKDESDLRNVFIERTQEGAEYLRSFAQLILDGEQGEPGPPAQAGDNEAVA